MQLPAPVMSSHFTNVDANTRDAGTKHSKPSKIPGLPTAQRGGPSGRKSPFSVSATGSPCYTPTSAPPATSLVPPSTASNLLRKSQTPTQIPVARHSHDAIAKSFQRPSLPPRVRTSLAIDTPTYLAPKKPTPTSARNKPLPSPPIVQLIDLNSPPKAQRTLVDAESGSPSEDEWPILRPENVSPFEKTLLSSDNKSVQQRSVSEGALPQQTPQSFFMDRNTPPSVMTETTSISTPAHLNKQVVPLHQPEVITLPERHASSPKNPFADSFHAISTDTDLAVESPLAHKKSVPSRIKVPHRISSKRSSMPLPTLNMPDSPTLTHSLQSRQTTSGSTKWPLVQQSDSNDIEIENSNADFEQETTTVTLADTQVSDTIDCKEPQDDKMCQETPGQDGLAVSSSSWSMAAGSSLGEEPHLVEDSVVRFKRLSLRSEEPGRGPLLTIHADADVVILGPSDCTPDMPSIPARVREKNQQDRSLSVSVHRSSSQPVDGPSGSSATRLQSSKTVDVEAKATTPVKIDPIRSMQPPRKVSSATKSSPSLSRESQKPSNFAPKASPVASEAPVSASGVTVLGSVAELLPASSEASYHTTTVDSYTTSDSQAETAILELPVPSKAAMVQGFQQDTSSSSARRRLPKKWISPTFSSKKSKKASSVRSDLSPSVRSASRLSSQYTTSIPAISEKTSPGAQSHDAVRPSKLRISESSASVSCHGSAGRDTPPSHRKNHQRSTPITSSSPLGNISETDILTTAGGQPPDGTMKKVKIKRSFREIFNRRDNKRTGTPPTTLNTSRQGFMTGSRSSIATRIRNSAHLSKAHAARVTEPISAPDDEKVAVHRGALEQDSRADLITRNADRQAALSSLEATPTQSGQVEPVLPQYDTATVINNIIDRVTSMPSESPDRLRGLEIAEAVLHAVECFKEAKLSAEQSRKHARNAELIVERAGIELVHLQKLCEPSFDSETMQALKELLKDAHHAGYEDKVVGESLN